MMKFLIEISKELVTRKPALDDSFSMLMMSTSPRKDGQIQSSHPWLPQQCSFMDKPNLGIGVENETTSRGI